MAAEGEYRLCQGTGLRQPAAKEGGKGAAEARVEAAGGGGIEGVLV
jgi:hypothetical protein